MHSSNFRRLGIVGAGLFFSITGMANPFFTLYAAEMGATTAEIGIIVMLRALLPILIAMPSGQLIDSIGPMKMAQIGSVLLLASLINTLTAQSVYMLGLSQLLMGACVIIMSPSLQVLVSSGEKAARNKSIAVYAMWMSAGGMIGPLAGGLIAESYEVPLDGYRMDFLISTVLAALFVVALAWANYFYPHPKPEPGEIRAIMTVRGVADSYKSGIHLTAHRSVQFGLIATFIIMYIQALYGGFLPLYLSQYGYSSLQIAAILAWQGLAAMMSRFILEMLTKRFTLETLLTGAGFVASFCVVLTPFVVSNTVATYALIFVLGGATGVNLPVGIMIMTEAVGPSQHGKLMGLRLLINRFSQTISPALFGVLGHFAGLTAAFFAGGGVLVLTMCGFTAYAARRILEPVNATAARDTSSPTQKTNLTKED